MVTDTPGNYFVTAVAISTSEQKCQRSDYGTAKFTITGLKPPDIHLARTGQREFTLIPPDTDRGTAVTMYYTIDGSEPTLDSAR